MINETAKIQRTIVIYTIISIILTAIIISVVSIYPFYTKLKKIGKEALVHERQTGALIVDGYVTRLREVASQIASRTKAKELIGEYNLGKISKSEMQQYLRKILNGALQSNTQISGIMRYDLRGKVLVGVGKVIPTGRIPKLGTNSVPILSTPFRFYHRYYLTISTPIILKGVGHIANDVILFDISDMEHDILEKIGHRFGDTLIVTLSQGKVGILNPFHSKIRASIANDPHVLKILSNAVKYNKSGFLTYRQNSKQFLVSYGVIRSAPWLIATFANASLMVSGN